MNKNVKKILSSIILGIGMITMSTVANAHQAQSRKIGGSPLVRSFSSRIDGNFQISYSLEKRRSGLGVFRCCTTVPGSAVKIWILDVNGNRLTRFNDFTNCGYKNLVYLQASRNYIGYECKLNIAQDIGTMRNAHVSGKWSPDDAHI
ncbi:hypothetical protein [Clostridium novyi]|uniref:hypothetical protein n=1 Tax=Clostridium novyi TaxID=1542 RepID=UPI0004D92E74|nr:hypothetical protein [Clostridium novyi]KEI08528.1 hypothetical protein Z958_12675 [Clostridium novyi B str. NCTC 9691]